MAVEGKMAVIVTIGNDTDKTKTKVTLRWPIFITWVNNPVQCGPIARASHTNIQKGGSRRKSRGPGL